MKRLELGGDFPEVLAPSPPAPGARPTELFPGARFFGTGRAALLALWSHGARTRGWRRLLVPSYVCGEIPEALGAARVPFSRYADAPDARPAGLPERVEPGDVLLRLQYFGWRGLEERDRAADFNSPVDVIEDHTHDPVSAWARGSRATYALSSLRKTAPFADGAIAWSPTGLELPPEPEPTEEHLRAAETKSAGMSLKRQYLGGAAIEKRRYTRLLADGEARLGAGSPSGVIPENRRGLESLDLLALAAARARGHERAIASGVPRSWITGRAPEGCHPFGVVLDLGTPQRRRRVRDALWRERIYTHTLWPLGLDADARARDFAERTLVMACDFRYPELQLHEAGRTIANVAVTQAHFERSLLGRVSAWLGR